MLPRAHTACNEKQNNCLHSQNSTSLTYVLRDGRWSVLTVRSWIMYIRGMHSGCISHVYTQARYMIQEYLGRSKKNIITANMYVSKTVQADIPLLCPQCKRWAHLHRLRNILILHSLLTADLKPDVCSTGQASLCLPKNVCVEQPILVFTRKP